MPLFSSIFAVHAFAESAEPEDVMQVLVKYDAQVGELI
jgi:hypothetical protein